MSQSAAADGARFRPEAPDAGPPPMSAPVEYLRVRGSAEQMALAVARLRTRGWQTAGPVEADTSDSWIVAVRRAPLDDSTPSHLRLAT